MRFSKTMWMVAGFSLIAALGGCASSMIEVRQGSDRVALAEINQVGGCQAKGEVTVSVLAKVGFFHRSTDDVEANLLQLARNYAVDSGADTVVKDVSSEPGKRTFKTYKCRP
ncbi:hypothetical protein MIZ01_0798 [Sideroxyarcus emersonii]|uniref:DUF4156 domain-containing protein n=1 Tax=Sideroxyarcus emersonii TaxID=2764705 RepID=A0AAN1X930_9PROT|nr:DUF4156 domain-containing protein [Sideroxyarcus emersonii]BCK87028.1 hypothetical protein MIZ01_0798 [Sideroxyarcus emersonii]